MPVVQYTSKHTKTHIAKVPENSLYFFPEEALLGGTSLVVY